MSLYADEDFDFSVVEELRNLGHDVVTAQEDSHRSVDDSIILERAHALGRHVLTHNRRDFRRLHRLGNPHSGIISATRDKDIAALSQRIHVALAATTSGRWHIRVNRPNPPTAKKP